jgi:hypothetical protein
VSAESIGQALKSTLAKKLPNRVTLFDYPKLGSDLEQQAVIINFGGMGEVQRMAYGNLEHLMAWLFECTLYTRGETTEPAEVHGLTLKGIDKIVDAVAENPHLGLDPGVVRDARVVNIGEVTIESVEPAMAEMMAVVLTVQVEEDRVVVPAE